MSKEEQADAGPSLEAVMAFVKENYEFVRERYPRIAQIEEHPELVFGFAVSHVAKHMAKNLGVISGQCENFDHGHDLNEEMLRYTTTKLFINVLELANMLGMSASDLCDNAPGIMSRAIKNN